MSLTKIGYRQRIADKLVGQSLRAFGAVSIEGPRWCGKTWTALNHANSVSYLMDENTRTLAGISVGNVLTGDSPHAIDEWQEIPAIWDAVRFAVDQGQGQGRFILTGSVIRPSEGIRHSGTGRIVRLRMRPMTLFESGDSGGDVSLGAILGGEDFSPFKTDPDIQKLVYIACRGGWPASLKTDEKSQLSIPVGYLDNISQHDASGARGLSRDSQKFHYFLASLARSNATIVKNTTIHNEVQSAAGEFSSNTLATYLQLLRELFMLEEIPGWAYGIRAKARIMSSPKRMFADPSLAVAALGATPEKLIENLAVFGGIFEGLCLRDLLVYAEANDARVFHYRDDSALEVDAIVETRGGDWGAFEIKLGDKATAKGVDSLLRLQAKISREKGKPPACLAVLTGGGIAMKRDDGILIVPITALRE